MSIILTLSVLITWLTLTIAFCALGGLFLHRVGRIESGWEPLYCSIWIGIALTTLGLVIWHFFFPVNAALGVFVALSVVALIVERRWFRPLLEVRDHLPFAIGAVALVAWTANHSLATGGMDDFNYEFQAIRWFFEHPLVPGLANLHGRLGFNNTHHLLAALFSAGHWAGHVNHILNGFIVSLVLVYVLFALVEVGRNRGRAPAEWLFASVLFAPAIGLVLFGIFGPAISTLKADVMVTAGIILLSCVLSRFAMTTLETQEYRLRAATVILLACLLTTVKLSAAAFCAVVVVAVVARLAFDSGMWLRESLSRRFFATTAAAAVLLILGFLARGIVMSGYPLYPSTAFGIDFDWRVPTPQAEADRVFIKTWSQLRPTYDPAAFAGQDWVRGWLNSLILTQKLSIVLPLVLLTVLAAGASQSGRDGSSRVTLENPTRPLAVVLAVASLVALAVWLTQAPAARFASIYFWIPVAAMIMTVAQSAPQVSAMGRLLTAALVCAAVAVFAFEMLMRYSRVEALHHPGVLAVLAFAALWAIAFLTVRDHPRVLFGLCLALGLSQIGERAAAHAVSGRLDEIGAMAWLGAPALPREPVFEHTARRTRSGLTIYVSKSSSFRTPIPNTRYFNPYLELRTPGDVRSGFRNRADAAVGYGYSVDYVMQPNAGTELVVPAGE